MRAKASNPKDIKKQRIKPDKILILPWSLEFCVVLFYNKDQIGQRKQEK